MFCPKCGVQNADETRFCRGCGVALGNVLAALTDSPPAGRELSEKYIELFRRGIMGSVIGLGFFFIAILSLTMGPPSAFVFVPFSLAFAFLFLGVGISRFVQASKTKALYPTAQAVQIAPAKPEIGMPVRSPYETDDLASLPASVTEHTTRHLEIRSEDETVSSRNE